MKLKSLTIKNYRSITKAYKIKISDYMILIGKNNEGKSNILKAIKIAFNIIRNYRKTAYMYLPRSEYDYSEDFPISLLNSKKLKDKKTVFKLDIEFSDEECNEFNSIYKTKVPKEFSIQIDINDRYPNLTIPTKGKVPANHTSRIVNICDYISKNLYVEYISAVRVQRDSVEIIDSLIDFELNNITDEEYTQAKQIVDKYHQDKIQSLEKRLKAPLKTFLPNIKDIRFEAKERTSYGLRRDIEILVDDGVLTSLKKKGDGVKSLFSIALLSTVQSNKNRIILIDEPENHLHPDAIHYINSVIADLSVNNQIIISSHNPIFVDRLNIDNNIIVEHGKAEPATKIDEIRKNIGVKCSDNLMYSDYVVVVEGPSDKELLKRYFANYPDLQKLLKSNKITIRSIGGTHNLESEVYSLDRYLCNYLILLDKDGASKTAVNNLKNIFNIDDNKFRYFSVNGNRDCELEDLLIPANYKSILLQHGIDIDCDLFKNKSRKWSDKVSDIANSVGIDFAPIEESVKTEISKNLPKDINTALTDKAKILLNGICEKIISDISTMNIIKNK